MPELPDYLIDLGWNPISTVPHERYVFLIDDNPRFGGNIDVGIWLGADDELACFWSRGGSNGGLEIGDKRHWMGWRDIPAEWEYRA